DDVLNMAKYPATSKPVSNDAPRSAQRSSQAPASKKLPFGSFVTVVDEGVVRKDVASRSFRAWRGVGTVSGERCCKLVMHRPRRIWRGARSKKGAFLAERAPDVFTDPARRPGRDQASSPKPSC
ncbi:hypothetical protein, partial [Brevundimonas sp.]|uniref:hypothetical protein n=1 Tax=Brevundimonas sp. TaxID=1871086 RepID=UPI0028997BA6